jgi:hypothetical protein
MDLDCLGEAVVEIEWQDRFELAMLGYSGAFERLLAATNEREALVALTDALNWLHSLEELHKERLGGERYFDERSKTPDGKTTGALVYARGAMHHRVVNWSPRGDAYSDLYTDGYEVLKWVDSAPEPDGKGRDAFFDVLVAGKPVPDTLANAYRFLTEQIARVT